MRTSGTRALATFLAKGRLVVWGVTVGDVEKVKKAKKCRSSPVSGMVSYGLLCPTEGVPGKVLPRPVWFLRRNLQSPGVVFWRIDKFVLKRAAWIRHDKLNLIF